MDLIKEAFAKVKEEISLLQKESNLLKKEVIEFKQTLIKTCEILLEIKQKNQENSDKIDNLQEKALSTENQEKTTNPTLN